MRLTELKRFVEQGAVIPRGWGISYVCWDRMGAIAYPLPFNLVVRWARNFYFWLMGSLHPSWIDERFLQVYQRGREVEREIWQEHVNRIEQKMDKLIEGVLAK